jgi:hypothetical protein
MRLRSACEVAGDRDGGVCRPCVDNVIGVIDRLLSTNLLLVAAVAAGEVAVDVGVIVLAIDQINDLLLFNLLYKCPVTIIQ